MTKVKTKSKLNRVKVIQALLKKSRTKNYLELGVDTGHCFLKIKADFKMGVGPSFQISQGRKFKYLLKNPSNLNNIYFEKTSDAFFADDKKVLQNNPPNVIFVDGLHTYEQSLKDVLNSLDVLDENGIIVMHDCNPLSEAAGYPADSIDHARSLNLEGWNNAWNGDVWKAVVHLRSLRSDLEVFVVDCDHGIGIVRRGVNDHTLPLTEAELSRLSYSDLESNRTRLLNLKSEGYFHEFIATLGKKRY